MTIRAHLSVTVAALVFCSAYFASVSLEYVKRANSTIRGIPKVPVAHGDSTRPFLRKDGCPPLFPEKETRVDTVNCTRAGLCAILKKQERYLEEWLEYYLALGFDRIILFDNSKDFTLQDWSYLRNSRHRRRDMISVVHLPGMDKQGNAYLDCARTLHEEQITWAAFFDTDEFLHLKRHDHVVDFLNDYLPTAGGGALALNWQVFMTGGHKIYEPRPVTQRFRLRQNGTDPTFKSIALLLDIDLEETPYPHCPVLKANGNAGNFDTNNKTVQGPKHEHGPSDVAVLYKYLTKSEEEYVTMHREGRYDVAGEPIVLSRLEQEARSLPRGDVCDHSMWEAMKKFVPRFSIFDEWYKGYDDTVMEKLAPAPVLAPDIPSCRRLWFAGFHAGNESFDLYAKYYSVALTSAPEFVQPVLVLGHLGLDVNPNATAPELGVFRAWTQSHGVIVIDLPKLSFQSIISEQFAQIHDYDPNDPYCQGPWMRMDIPNVIEDYDLFSLPGICPDKVLYTDADVIFYDISKSSLEEAMDLVSEEVSLAYGPEAGKNDGPFNTGVMMVHVEGFRQIVPKILDFGSRRNFPDPAFDQGLINAFFLAERPKGRTALEPSWNYKAYWGRKPGERVEIMHFHGPKPGRGLDCCASGSVESPACSRDFFYREHYLPLAEIAFRSDGGALARELLETFYGILERVTWLKNK